MSLPAGWVQKESKSHAGKIFYFNKATGETTWDKPDASNDNEFGGGAEETVQVLHILKKHRGSRRPSSWRVQNITQTKDEAIEQIKHIRAMIDEEYSKTGFNGAVNLFKSIARRESDCGSAERGGDLGEFGRGQMQKSFEDSSFRIAVGGLSELVDSDSGIHVILRIK